MTENIRQTHITVQATPGSEIGPCIDDTVILAMQRGVPIVLCRNGKTYRAEPVTLRNAVFDTEKEDGERNV